MLFSCTMTQWQRYITYDTHISTAQTQAAAKIYSNIDHNIVHDIKIASYLHNLLYNYKYVTLHEKHNCKCCLYCRLSWSYSLCFQDWQTDRSSTTETWTGTGRRVAHTQTDRQTDRQARSVCHVRAITARTSDHQSLCITHFTGQHDVTDAEATAATARYWRAWYAQLSVWIITPPPEPQNRYSVPYRNVCIS